MDKLVQHEFDEGKLKGSAWPSFHASAGQPAVLKNFPRALAEQFCLMKEDGVTRNDCFWYDEENLRISYTNKSTDSKWRYCQVITLDSYTEELFDALVKASSTTTNLIAMISFQVSLWSAMLLSDQTYPSVVAAPAVAFSSTLFVMSLALKAGEAVAKVHRQLYGIQKRGQQVGIDPDIAKRTGWMWKAKFWVLAFVGVPKLLRDAPIAFHIRKAAQAFMVTKKDGRRIWLLGFLSEDQYKHLTSPYSKAAHTLEFAHATLLSLQLAIAFHAVASCTTLVPMLLAAFGVVSHLGRCWEMRTSRTFASRCEVQLKEEVSRLSEMLQTSQMTLTQRQHLTLKRDVVSRCLAEDFGVGQ